MSNQIRISPEAMRGRSNEYHQESVAIETVISKMDTLIARLQEEWEGQASHSFEQQYNELKPSFKNMQTLVETIARQLQQTAQAMEDMDKDIASKFGAN